MKKNTKRILAALLVMCSLLQLGIITYAESQDDTETESNADIMLLTNLGFVNDTYGPKSGDELVTRAQLASMVAYLRGFDESYSNISKKFIDIPADYWCAGQIYALNDVGLIHGTSEDMFSPTSYVTYPQVVKCLVSLLGYDVQAEQLGGYPNGYLSVASRIGLPSGKATGSVDFAAVAKLMVKAMDTDVLELKMVDRGEASYEKVQNQTPLKKYNDIYYNTGIMTDNGISTLIGDTYVGSNSVTINDVVFDKGNCNCEKYLGYSLKYYYKDIDGDLTLLFAVPYRMKVVELTDDEIDVDQSQFSTKRIYYDAEKSGYYRIDDYVDVIYNGRAYPAFDVNTLKLTQGTLTLIDNDDDGDYEVILVDEYYNIYVSGIDVDEEIIYGKYGNSVDYGKFDNVEFCTTDGSPAAVNSINEKQVLSVFESFDDAFLKVVISTGGVSGKVEAITDIVTKPNFNSSQSIENFKLAARDTKIIVDGEELEFSLDYINAVAAGYQGTSIPVKGLAYSFHLDSNRKIAGIEDPTGVQYAYLVKVTYSDHGDMAGMTKAKLFLEDETILTTVFAKKVTVNGEKYKGQSDETDAVFRLSEFYDNGDYETGVFVQQPVKVRLNNLGEITELETASECTSSYKYDTTKFTRCFSSNSSEYGGHSQRTFNGQYTLAYDVVIFNVPPADDFDINELSVISESKLVEGSSYPITLYDADASWACKFAVIQAGASEDWFLAPCIVQTIREELVDDEPAKVVTGLESTNWVTYVEDKPGVFPTELAVGDIVRVVKGTSNRIINMEILASPTRDADRLFHTQNNSTEWETYYGQLYARSDTGFTLTLDGGVSIEGMPFNDTPVNVYDVNSKTARRGSRNDMVMNCPIKEDGTIDLTNCNSKIYVFKRRGYARGVVVVKY